MAYKRLFYIETLTLFLPTDSKYVESAYFVCVSLLSTAVSANTLFRYANEKGGKVIADSIPHKYAAKGYEIIGSSGQVI